VAAGVSFARLYDDSGDPRSRAPNPEADPAMHASVLRKKG
jgi:hypothetical protein